MVIYDSMEQPVKPRRSYNAALRRENAKATQLRILESARRLFETHGYGKVTMAEIAREAGVSYQTVYAVFGTKLGVARGIIWSTFEVEGIHDLIGEAMGSPDPEEWMRSVARTARLISDRLGGLLRFLRESGDPELLAEYEKVEERRLEQERFLAVRLEQTGRLKAGLSTLEALDLLWAMTGSQLHQQLVFKRQWAGDRYERWLADALGVLLLQPREDERQPG